MLRQVHQEEFNELSARLVGSCDRELEARELEKGPKSEAGSLVLDNLLSSAKRLSTFDRRLTESDFLLSEDQVMMAEPHLKFVFGG